MKKLLIFIMCMIMVTNVAYALSTDRTDTIISLFATNSTNSSHAVGDFSGGHNFTIKPPSDEVWIISRLLVHIEDDKNWDATKYGKDITLTNGIEIQYIKDNEIITLTNGNPVTKTAEWGAMCYDVALFDGFTGTDFANIRWTFSKSGSSIMLNGTTNDEIRVVFNDDISGLVDHHYLFQGYKLETIEGDSVMISGTDTIAFMILYLVLAWIIYFIIYNKSRILGGFSYLVLALTTLVPFNNTDYLVISWIAIGIGLITFVISVAYSKSTRVQGH